MVERADINAVLVEMRRLRSQLRAQHQQQLQNQVGQGLKPNELQPLRAVRLSDQVKALEGVKDVKGDPNVPNFKTMFKNAIDGVNTKQKTANNLATRFEQGDPNVDLPEVMIALQKSSVSFQAMTQVRNKLVDAYKEIMNMPL